MRARRYRRDRGRNARNRWQQGVSRFGFFYEYGHRILQSLAKSRLPCFHSAWRADRDAGHPPCSAQALRSEEHTSELQSLMRISYAVFCLKKKIQTTKTL